jgi:hypothetical protein
MIVCVKLCHSDLDAADDCKLQPLGDLKGAEHSARREERLLLT